MHDDKIKIGFICAGGNTKLKHIPGFQKIEGVELVSVANRSIESGQKISDEFGIPNVYANWQELLEADDCDAICIGTWPYLHSTLVLESLANEKHVLTEARMAMNASQAHEMLAASFAHPNLVSQIVPAPHTLKLDQTIQDLIQNGYLGELISVELNLHEGNFVDRNSNLHWRHNRDLSGFNIMQLGIWYEAMMRWVGPAESVIALTKTHVKYRKDENEKSHHITIPDHIEILAELASGPTARLRLSTVLGHAPSNNVWIYGTDATLMIEAETMTLFGGSKKDSKLKKIEIPEDKQGSWRVEEEFINAIRGIEPVTHTNFYDGVRYMEFTEAVTRSSQTGMKINLPL